MLGGMDTVAERWAALKPHVAVHGPVGPDRQVVLLFHGCGGVRSHLDRYAQAAVVAGWTAVIVDSYAHRGWTTLRQHSLVCTGVRFWGRERAGDALAAAAGVIAEGWADPQRLAMAGWSHGGWTIMDLMCMPLSTPGEAGLADPDGAVLDGLRGVFLVYPFGGVAALSRTKTWRRTPRVLGVRAKLDHVTNAADTRRIFAAATRAGADVEMLEVKGTHFFDEERTPPLSILTNSRLAAEPILRFRRFLTELADPRFITPSSVAA